jgi:hypothetical protein
MARTPLTGSNAKLAVSMFKTQLQALTGAAALQSLRPKTPAAPPPRRYTQPDFPRVFAGP